MNAAPWRLRTAAGALAVALASCSPSPPAPAASAPEARGPRVVLPSGKAVEVEVAATEAERSQGLMFRESLPADAGMIFLFETAEARPFWMKNCHFPLDIVHLRSDGTVVDVLANVPPCAADPCPTYPPKAASTIVLELNAGAAATNGVVAGSTLRLIGIPGR